MSFWMILGLAIFALLVLGLVFLARGNASKKGAAKSDTGSDITPMIAGSNTSSSLGHKAHSHKADSHDANNDGASDGSGDGGGGGD